jgi:enoyl-CoA hydratase/carnithine racemase
VRGHRVRDRGPGLRPSRSTVPRCETPSGSRLLTSCGTLYSPLKTTPASGCCADRRRRKGVLQRRGRPDGVRAEQAPAPAAGSEVHGVVARGGYALGGGFELARSCDLIVSSNTPTFGPPEFSVGVVPAFALIRLAEVAGRAWTKSLAWPGLAWSARRATVAEAHQRGVVDWIVADAELDAESLRVAQDLTSCLEWRPRSSRRRPIGTSPITCCTTARRRMRRCGVRRGLPRDELHISNAALRYFRTSE